MRINKKLSLSGISCIKSLDSKIFILDERNTSLSNPFSVNIMKHR
jgi:hypothetical protein